MLDSFTVSHKTDGETLCKITVMPGKRQADVLVTVARVIVHIGDETHVGGVMSFTHSDWRDISLWESKAAALAKHFSPFWRGESAA